MFKYFWLEIGNGNLARLCKIFFDLGLQFLRMIDYSRIILITFAKQLRMVIFLLNSKNVKFEEEKTIKTFNTTITTIRYKELKEGDGVVWNQIVIYSLGPP